MVVEDVDVEVEVDFVDEVEGALVGRCDVDVDVDVDVAVVCLVVVVVGRRVARL